MRAFVAVLAGCGGSGGGTLSKAEYEQQAGEACTASVEAARGLDRTASSAESIGRARAIENIVRDKLAALDELEPPPDTAADHDELVATVTDSADALGRFAEAMETGDSETAARALIDRAAAQVRVEKAAESVGALACVQDEFVV